jgi:hypothetical protein
MPTWAPSSGGGNPRVTLAFNFETAARYGTNISGSGAVSFGDFGTQLTTGATGGSEVAIYVNAVSSATTYALFDHNPTAVFAQDTIGNTGTGDVFRAWGVSLQNDGGQRRTATEEGIWFQLDSTSGTPALYACNANGSANTNTDISSGVTLTIPHVYTIVMTSGTDIKFYVDGTLKATHTTNLPAGAMPLTSRTMGIAIDNPSGTTTVRTDKWSHMSLSFDAN